MVGYKKKLLLSITILFLSVTSGCGPGLPDWRGGIEPGTSPEVTEGGVRFSIYMADAGRVNLVGDFNNWSTTADPFYDRERNGLWTILIPLPPGRYEYKILIDGEKWIPDPGNPERVDDGFGGLSSVIIVE